MTPDRMATVLGELVASSLQQVLADWETQIGLQARSALVASELVRDLPVWRPHWNDDWAAVLQTRIQGPCQGPIHVVFPHDFVWVVLRAALGIPKDSARMSGAALKPDELDAFKEMMNLLCGSFNTVLSAFQKGLRVSQSVEHLKLDQLAPGRSPEPALPRSGLGVAISIEHDDQRYEVLTLMPVPLARSVSLEAH